MNSRQPLSKLARKIRCSTQVAWSRLQSLQSEGKVICFLPLINHEKLGSHFQAMCFLKLQRISASELDSFLKKAAQDQQCTISLGCAGAYEAIIGTVAVDLVEAKEVMGRLLSPLGDRVRECDMEIITSAHHYGRRYFLEDLGLEHFRAPIIRTGIFGQGSAKESQAPSAGQTEIKILKAISSNARLPLLEIASKAGCSPQTARSRLRELARRGAIAKYGTVLNPSAYGYVFFRLKTLLSQAGRKPKPDLAGYLKRYPEVFRLSELFSINGYLIDIVAKDEERVREIMDGMRDDYPDSIALLELMRVNSIFKFCYFQEI